MITSKGSTDDSSMRVQTLNWRDPNSTEIQRRQWEQFCRDMVLLSCPLLWPLLILGARR